MVDEERRKWTRMEKREERKALPQEAHGETALDGWRGAFSCFNSSDRVRCSNITLFKRRILLIKGILFKPIHLPHLPGYYIRSALYDEVYNIKESCLLESSLVSAPLGLPYQDLSKQLGMQSRCTRSSAKKTRNDVQELTLKFRFCNQNYRACRHSSPYVYK